MRITLKQLMVFDAIARTGQVARAAEQLNLSSPATSMALAELEKQLGARLFERRSNKLQLNAQGSLLLPLAADVLERVDQIEHAFSQQGSGLRGTLTVSASSTIGNYLLAPAAVAFSRTYPDAQVQLDICNTREVIDAVAQGRSELGFIEGHCLDRRLTVEGWFGDTLSVFAAPDHPLAGQEVTISSLGAARWILREEGSGTREIFISAAMGQGLYPDVAFSFTGQEAVKQAVRQGGSLGVLSSLTLEQAFARGELVPVSVPSLQLKRPFYIISHKGRRGSALGRAYRSFCDGWAEQHLGQHLISH
ncbi:LysR family transcriptional regulator [Shewanella sp. NFH-SH190041]|uniref:LysR substrate-binding domain-containing protein n=1 Tax=Shewanella sp. NFH-SH190041 TaxID=2950245 RepID=UPI0021C49141|nr:LysR substrate-binding domain-containing protein [Shewanella sp. NFH-SH190041]BDM64071.1 LysR family transcriptional regulator [Shewanella sp. NFH-SH190041]